MDEPQAAPPVDPSQNPQPVAPPPEQAQTTAPADGTPTTDAGLMRAFTQSQQKLSAVAAALGIPKTATIEQFTAAINERRRVLAQADAELDSNPELARRAAALRAQEARLASQQYPEAAALASTLLEQVASAGSYLEAVQIVDEALIERAAARFAGATPAPAGGSPQPQQAQPAQPARPAPERDLLGDTGRLPGNVGMFDPEVTASRDEGPLGFFRKLGQKHPITR